MAPQKELDASSFSEKSRKDLLRLLEHITGKKTLVLAKGLVGSIDLLVKFTTLQEHGVDRVFFLENDNVESSQRHVVFLASGEKPQHVAAIASQIKRLRSTAQTEHEYHAIWVPRRTLVCEKALEEAGILGDVHNVELPLFFQAVEGDLLSMELEESFSDLYLRKDPTCIFLAAKALTAIQQRHGLFPHIIGKGDHAKRLADLLVRMRSELSADKSNIPDGVPSIGMMPSSSIESLIIIDREVDFTSVLLTQLTYEGLIDETFGINHTQVELDSSILSSTPAPTNQSSSSRDGMPLQPPQTLKRKIKLDSSDKLYTSIRDVNFVVVGSLLNKIARRLQSDYETRAGPQKTVAELRDFVSKLPGYQAEQASLRTHTALTEEIMKQTSQSEIFGRALHIQQDLVAGMDPSALHDDIEELIARGAPIATILRLLCIESCIAGGLKPRDYDNFRRQILHAYGHQHLLTLAALAKMQLLEPRGQGAAAAMVSSSLAYLPGTGGSSAAAPVQPASLPKTNYAAVRRPLRLILDEVSEQDPEDVAYVYSGYAPLSVRLVQCVLQKGYLSTLSTRRGATEAKNGDAAAAAAPAPNAASNLDVSAGWRPFDSAVANVRGATVHVVQAATEPAAKARAVLSGHGAREGAAAALRKTTLVFYLGGVTFAEVAALRFVGRQLEGQGRRLVVCTTGMVSGDGVVKAALEGR